MSFIQKALKEKKALTPKKGFNLVGVDTFGAPDEQGLFLVDHYDDKAEAEAELEKCEARNPHHVKFYIYGPG